MAHDQERAERIRTLKESRPDLTWHDIGDKVGVSERSAIEWQKTGGISHPNCKKLAKIFRVDEDWLWSGRAEHTPDLMGALTDDGTRLGRIEAKLDQIIDMLGLGPAEVLEAEADRLDAQQDRSAAKSGRTRRSRKAS